MAGALLGGIALVVLGAIWTSMYREMGTRGRPTWLRVAVLVTNPICMIGLPIWMVDRKNHPPVPTAH